MDTKQEKSMNVYKLWEQIPINDYPSRIVDRPWQIKIETPGKWLSHSNYDYKKMLVKND